MSNKHTWISKEAHKTLKILAARRGVTIMKVADQVLIDAKLMEPIKKGDR